MATAQSQAAAQTRRAHATTASECRGPDTKGAKGLSSQGSKEGERHRTVMDLRGRRLRNLGRVAGGEASIRPRQGGQTLQAALPAGNQTNSEHHTALICKSAPF